MKKNILVSSLIFLLHFSSNAQIGHAIRIKIKGIIPQKTCFLGYYNGFGTITEVEQSAPDQNGYMIFGGSKTLPQGLYKVTITPKKGFEIIITDQQNFSVSTDTLDFYNQTKFIGSNENQVFYDYQAKMAKFIADGKTAGIKEAKLDSLQTEIKKFRESFLKKNEGTFAAKLVKASVIPEPSKKLNTEKAYLFYQDHFWDNIDLSDARYLNTPILPEKIDEYIDKLTYPNVDSLTKASVYLIEKVKANKEMFRYFLSYLVRKFENPKINGTEGVYVNLAEKYYMSKQATWIDDYTLSSIKQKTETMKPLLLGKVFPDMELKTPDNKAFTINGLQAKYTVIFFYSPTCSHCQATMPKVKQFYEKYKSHGVEVLAISVRESGPVWKDFIAKQGVANMVHGWENKDDGFYYYKYDVTIFPTIYVLNEKKQIIGRKLTGEELGSFIDFTEGK